jgi:hypothetical protein
MSSDEAFIVQVLGALKATRLEAIVVGNVAAILQGVPVTTQDLDLLVRDTPLNRQKIDAMGAVLGARPRRISPLADVLRIDAPGGTVDVVFAHLPGGLSFERVRARAVRLALGAQRAVVARLEDVIASKAAADRPKDRAQLPILRDTLKVKGALDETISKRPRSKKR